MSAEIPVPAREHGVLRLFSLSMDDAEAKALNDPEALARALRVDRIAPAHAEVIALADIGALGLATYLTEGMGLKADQVRAERGRIDALDGHVLLLRSGALEGCEAVLRPEPRLTLIATFREDRAAPPPMTPLRSDSATGGGTAEAPPPAPPARKGSGRRMLWTMLALAVLIALAFVLVAG